MHVTLWDTNVPRCLHSRCTRQNFWHCYPPLRLSFQFAYLYICLYKRCFIANLNWILKDILWTILLWYWFVLLCMHFICIWLIGQYWPEVSIKYIYMYIYILMCTSHRWVFLQVWVLAISQHLYLKGLLHAYWYTQPRDIKQQNIVSVGLATV